MTTYNLSINPTCIGKDLSKIGNDSWQSATLTIQGIVNFNYSQGKAIASGQFDYKEILEANEKTHKNNRLWINASLLIIDSDDGDFQYSMIDQDIFLKTHLAAAYPSSSHSDKKTKYHFIFTFDKSINDATVYKAVALQVMSKCPFNTDKSMKTVSQGVFGTIFTNMNGHKKELNDGLVYINEQTKPIDTDVIIQTYDNELEHTRHDAPHKTETTGTQSESYAQKAYQGVLDELASTTEGGRNNACIKASFNLYSMVKGNWPTITESMVISDLKRIAVSLQQSDVIDGMLERAARQADARPFPVLQDNGQYPSLPQANGQQPPPNPVGSLPKEIYDLSQAIKSDDEKQHELADRVQITLNKFQQKQHQVKIVSSEGLLDKLLDKAEERYANPVDIIGLDIGLTEMVKLTGGFDVGIHVFMGATGTGKTGFMTTIANNLMNEKLLDGGQIIVQSTELHFSRWLERLLCVRASTPTDPITGFMVKHGNLSASQYSRYVSACSYYAPFVKNGQLSYIDGLIPDPKAFYLAVMEAHKKKPIKALFIDSITEVALGDAENARQRIDEMTIILANLSVAGITQFVTTQTGRKAENRKDKQPMKGDAMHSSSIEARADTLWGLYNHQQYIDIGEIDRTDSYYHKLNDRLPKGVMSVRLLKNREGPNEGKRCRLAYRGGAGFFNLAHQNER